MELIQNPDSTDVSDLQTVTSMLPTIEDEVMKGSTGEEGEVKLDLAELDKACENVALMIQYIDSYEGFIRHCVEEIGRAQAYREGSCPGSRSWGRSPWSLAPSWAGVRPLSSSAP
jgi:hypothetical protein